MSNAGRIGTVLALAAAVVVVVVLKANLGGPAEEAPPAEVGPLPRLVDLGANTCIPCKMMAPILEELTDEYRGRLHVEVIDVQQNREAAKEYGIRVIPTQIFFDPDGQERFRHEGFMSKEDILQKWQELSVDLTVEAGR
jgi:thioredoxin 1